MALRRRGAGGSDSGLSAWPGYVDALSTLLMVIIFVLLVFVLAQAFLSVALSGRDRALDRLNRQVAELSDMLSLEKGRTAELTQSLSQLNRDLATARAQRDDFGQQLATLRTQAGALAAERDSLKTDRDRLAARLADAGLQTQSAQARVDTLAGQLADASQKADAQADARGANEASLLEEMRRQIAQLDATHQVDQATLAAKLSDLARLTEQARALTALRDDLEKQVKDAAARADLATTQLKDQQKLSESAQAQAALLASQMDELKAQLASLQKALEASEASGRDKDVQIANLGSRLNAALAQKVEELQKYRSEFFGKLRAVLANRPGIQIVGDRFVFQSEVLFPPGSAELSPAGAEQVSKLAATLKEIGKEIPPDVHWILRVDGHADRQPISGRWGSNWELSAGRAITVVKLLIFDGIPADRLAATGFGDTQPLDPADTPAAYARNRRIELRLTDR